LRDINATTCTKVQLCPAQLLHNPKYENKSIYYHIFKYASSLRGNDEEMGWKWAFPDKTAYVAFNMPDPQYHQILFRAEAQRRKEIQSLHLCAK